MRGEYGKVGEEHRRERRVVAVGMEPAGIKPLLKGLGMIIKIDNRPDVEGEREGQWSFNVAWFSSLGDGLICQERL